VVVYLDAILIYTETMEEYYKLVSQVFSILQKEGLAVAAHKLFFHVQEVEFLGYIIDANGVEMYTRKVEAVRSWETPKNLKDVQRILGFANFYPQFTKTFSGVARPITDLTRNKGLDFHWGPMQIVAFQQLTEVFTSTPMSKHCDPALEVIIETDASNFAIRCILSQKHNGRQHPVAFHSRKMEPAEKNYDIHYKELLAVVEAFKHWCPYCYGA
jgi:hypothetical protein